MVCGAIATAGSGVQTTLGLASIIISGIALLLIIALIFLGINGSIIAELCIAFNGAKDCIGNYLRNFIFACCISFFINIPSMSFMVLGAILYSRPILNVDIGIAMMVISGLIFLPGLALVGWIIGVFATNLIFKLIDR